MDQHMEALYDSIIRRFGALATAVAVGSYSLPDANVQIEGIKNTFNSWSKGVQDPDIRRQIDFIESEIERFFDLLNNAAPGTIPEFDKCFLSLAVNNTKDE